MHETLIHRAKELNPATRKAIESEFGRPLEDEEEVGIFTFAPHDEPQGDAREKAAKELLTYFDEADARGAASEEQVEAAIQEAMRDVRPGYRERK